MNGQQPLIFAVKGNALDDGPGIRSVVFFKGCPLSCTWCHNPESKRREVEISYDAQVCIGCDTCLAICPEQALNRANANFIDRSTCNLCFQCAEACPAGALSRVGELMTADEVLAALLKDKPFYDASGGGVTLSGGEATLFTEYLAQLLRKLKAAGVHTLLETCGLFNMKRFKEAIYPWLDLIYFDVKLMDAGAHIEFCGTSNQVILQNFAALAERAQQGGVPILPRIPLIPGVTATEQNLRATADFLIKCHAPQVALLPYHPTWQEKERKLGITETNGKSTALGAWLDDETLADSKSIFVEVGIEIV
ncbi:MAG: glycyl-radical enzyme activating protein [Candidatus Promineifilaceae bacterium]|nr:glycyl-radical enzyme activating protein [Candidatus Promineifilaceae bacterium]